jgi:hypothetical protein
MLLVADGVARSGRAAVDAAMAFAQAAGARVTTPRRRNDLLAAGRSGSMGDPACYRDYCPTCDMEGTITDDECPGCGTALKSDRH